MSDFLGFRTTDGRNVFSNDAIEKLRGIEESKKKSNVFIPHKGAQENDLQSSVDILITGGNRGGGKANSYRTPVATPTGFKLMGDLVVGDEICTPWEGIQKVSAIYEQGENITYIMEFDDGTSLECMDNHRFLARVGSYGRYSVMTAREIMDCYKLDAKFPNSLRRGHNEYVEIPICGEVEMQENNDALLPLSPLILGYISRNGKWEFSKLGVEIRNMKFRTICRAIGYKVRYNDKNGGCYIRNISDEARRFFTHKRTETDAYIPDAYMCASIRARMEFLMGFMCETVHSTKRHPYISLPNKKLIEQVAQMVRSLGGWARVTPEYDMTKYGYWRVSIIMPNDKDIVWGSTKHNRAQINCEKPKSPKDFNSLTKKIIQIKKLKYKTPCRCITVTGEQHLYMTDAWTINHNTLTMLMEPIYDINNKYFNGIIFRKNKDDFDNIINESKRWFEPIGRYNRSKDDMTWYFNSGAQLGLSIYDMPLREFDDKYRGQQFAYIGIDELPQMPFEQFKFLMTSNRNTVGIRSRILATCNPDPLSWLRTFLDWWIGKEDTIYEDGKMHPERKGYIIPERDGVVRYCYMPTNTVDGIIWGDTPEEVYEQCKEEIDGAWDPDFEQFGYTKTSFFVKSVTFIKASIKENKALLKNDPGYIASILNQPPEIRAREWDGNWDYIEVSNDLIKAYHMDAIFDNAEQLGDNIRRASCDVAATGGDNCVVWFWVGWHVSDVFVCRRDPYTTIDMIKAKLNEWGVLEQNFTYDLQGMGQVLKGAFPNAVPFNNQEAVDREYKNLYDCKKSQCAYKFAERTQQRGWSINKELLQNRYPIGKNVRLLRDILQLERKCIKQDMSKQDRGWCLIHKEQMKHRTIVGHSPDFFEALFMREIFDIKATETEVPDFLRGHIRKMRTYSLVN